MSYLPLPFSIAAMQLLRTGARITDLHLVLAPSYAEDLIQFYYDKLRTIAAGNAAFRQLDAEL
jgi:hypothetical protein